MSAVAPLPGDTPRRDRVIGLLCGLGVACIWSAWLVMTRHAVTTGLAPQDVTFLRYGVSTLFLAPVAWRERARLRQVPPRLALAMVAGAGLPFMGISATAMQYAPAVHGATLQIGTNPIFVALLGVGLLGERLGRAQLAGIAAVLGGVVLLALDPQALGRATAAWQGDVLFVAAGFLFACFTVAQRRSGLTALQAIALVNVTSCLLFVGPYVAWLSPRLAQVAWGDLLAQAFAQGVANALLALFLYAEAVRRLGATRAAVLGALVPALTMTLGSAVLGETPGPLTLLAAALVTAGVVLVVARRGR